MHELRSIIQVLDRIGEKRTLLNNILRRNCLLHDPIKVQMTEVKRVVRRRRTLLLDDLRNRRRLIT